MVKFNLALGPAGCCRAHYFPFFPFPPFPLPTRSILLAFRKVLIDTMRFIAFLLLLQLIASGCLCGIEKSAFGGEFPPATNSALRRPRTLVPRSSQPAWTSHAIVQPYGHRDAGPSAWYGHSMGVPTYNWGHFGVKARPYWVNQGSYHGDHVGWSFRRGY